MHVVDVSIQSQTFHMYSWSTLFSNSRNQCDTAVGPDDIHYQMLKHLPHNAKQTLLDILKSVWCSGKFPSSWHSSSIVMPIPKPGKDKTYPLSYHPIALTSCICKVMEHMINNRLVWYLEKNKLMKELKSFIVLLITSVQCGFRKQRSTTDHLVRLESLVHEAFVQWQHAVVIFLDL